MEEKPASARSIGSDVVKRTIQVQENGSFSGVKIGGDERKKTALSVDEEHPADKQSENSTSSESENKKTYADEVPIIEETGPPSSKYHYHLNLMCNKIAIGHLKKYLCMRNK